MLSSARSRREQSKAKRDGVKHFRARELIFCTSTLGALHVKQDESKWSWTTSLLGKEPWPLTLLGRDVNEGRRHDYNDPMEGNEIGNEQMIEKATVPSQADRFNA